jgi:hypothetical protein
VSINFHLKFVLLDADFEYNRCIFCPRFQIITQLLTDFGLENERRFGLLSKGKNYKVAKKVMYGRLLINYCFRAIIYMQASYQRPVTFFVAGAKRVLKTDALVLMRRFSIWQFKNKTFGKG